MLENDEQNKDNIKVCKVILVGESGVGKTCITNKYVKGTFNKDESSTMTAAYAEKNIIVKDSGQAIKFNIWDTAGQERFRSIGKIFYKEANAAILVYDITTKKSFEEIQNYWYNEIQKAVPKDTNK
jgi:small GTP-binding protein